MIDYGGAVARIAVKPLSFVGLLVAGLCLIILAGCSGLSSNNHSKKPPPPEKTVVTIPSAPASLEVSSTWQLTADVSNDAANGGVMWTCSPANACGTFNPQKSLDGGATTYTAPSAVPTGDSVTVKATAVDDTSATASATINITTTTSADFFVAPNGSDSNPGTLSAPFLTIGKAQVAVRALNKNGRTNAIVVMLRGGVYAITQPLSFTTSDSGTSGLEIFWVNYPGETPVVSGGERLTGWVQNGSTWTVNLPSGTNYFEQMFYNGHRRLRARAGATGNPPVGAYYRVAATIYSSTATANCPDFVSGQGYECYDRFQYTPGDPVSASWVNLSPPSGNPCGAAPGSKGYPVGDIALYSFEQMGMSKMLINCVDTSNRIIYLTGPIRFDPVTSGFVPGHRYMIENAKDSLTQPGQWFIDRHTTPWVLTYIANSGENPNNDNVIVPQSSQAMIASGLQYVTFQGLTFEHDNYTVPAAGYPYNRLDQMITSAVSCQNCQHVTFDSDTITETAGTGIDFTTTSSSSTSTENVLENSAIYDVAAHGVRIGLLSANSDTPTNLPHSNTVENNVIEGFGRTFAKAFGIAQGCNHDNLYTHNQIYDGYSGGINIGALNCPVAYAPSLDSNNVASFNLIYNLGQGVTNDFGCVYFNTSPNGLMPPSGNQALNNVCHDVTDGSALDADGYGGQGIYIDNYTGLIDVENNLVYRMSGSTIAQTCGPQEVAGAGNIIKNNILAFAKESIKQNGCTPSSSSDNMFEMTNNLVIYDHGHVQGGCFSCLGGNCSNVLPATMKFANNMYCYAPSGSSCTLSPQTFAFFSSQDPPNQAGGCAQSTTYSTLAAWQAIGEDDGSVLKNPFNSTSPTNNDYSLSSSPGVGFVVFDPTQAGRTDPVIMPPAVDPGFYTVVFAPSQF